MLKVLTQLTILNICLFCKIKNLKIKAIAITNVTSEELFIKGNPIILKIFGREILMFESVKNWSEIENNWQGERVIVGCCCDRLGLNGALRKCYQLIDAVKLANIEQCLLMVKNASK